MTTTCVKYNTVSVANHAYLMPIVTLFLNLIITGLKHLHKLTSEGTFDLRIQMSSFDGRTMHAEYKSVCLYLVFV